MTSKTAPRNGKFLSIRWKILIPLTLVFSILLLLTYNFLDQSLERSISEVFKEEITKVAEYTAGCIDGDGLQTLQANPSTESDDYFAVLDCFDEVFAFNARVRLITYHLNDNGEFEIGVDSEVGFDPDALEIGETLNDEKMVAYFGEFQDDAELVFQSLHGGLEETSFQDEYYIDTQDNAFFVGYTPIYNAQNEPVAGLIVRIIASEAVDNVTFMQSGLLIGFAIALVTTVIVLLIITRATTVSLRFLSENAEKIGDGTYEDIVLPKKNFFRDEVDELTEMLNEMIDKVYTRETKLVNQVTRLKVSLDKGRAKDDLDDIVETDFFRNLQSKAKENRALREKNEAEG